MGIRTFINRVHEEVAVNDPEQLQKLALQYTEQGQDATANLVRTLSENWANAVRTAWGAGSAETSSQPSPAEVIDRTFDFNMQMIEAQRRFAHQLVEAGRPVAEAMQQATDATAETAQQETAKGSGASSGSTSGRTSGRTSTGGAGGTRAE